MKNITAFFFSMLVFSMCIRNSLFAKDFEEITEGYIPLYAGTMLAFFSSNVDPGRLAIQPYFFQNWQTGFYDKNWAFHKQETLNQSLLLTLIETGISSNMDITILASASYNNYSNKSSILYDDTRLYLGFQILRDKKGLWTPDLRVLLGENFPTGKYKNLSPKRNLNDSSGSGSYETFIILVTRKIFYFFEKHPFNININLLYSLATKTSVKGVSIYGGTKNSRGSVNPGSQYLINIAIEYSLTRNWVLGLDTRYLHQQEAKYFCKHGCLQGAGNNRLGLASSEQLSLAPCIEYNFNENFGILAGSWFTVGGRNAQNFTDAVVSVYYEY